MKSYILSIALVLLFFQGQSQNIANTKWKTFNTSLLDTITVDITLDTIFQYVRPDTMLTVSFYTQRTDTVELNDVSGTFACLINETGLYSFVIVGDTLTINLLTDQCLARSIVYDGTKLWRIDKPTGISEIEESPTFKLYPNPSNGFVTIETLEEGSITIYNSVGQIVIQKELYEKNNALLIQLNKGSYIIKYHSKDHITTRRLLVN